MPEATFLTDRPGWAGTLPFRAPQEHRATWVVILAGGDGRRIGHVTRDSSGRQVPKQFCRFRDERSLLQAALDRGLGLTDIDRTVAVVVEAHRRWWQRELGDLGRSNVIAQPQNRGTGIAVLHALVHVCLREPNAVVVLLPSDHDFEREEPLRDAVLRAVEIAGASPDKVVMLGTTPAYPDTDCGWIVPGRARGDGTHEVRAVVEKPTSATYAVLRRQGALCNTFVLAATVQALFRCYVEVQSALLTSFLCRLGWNTSDPDALRDLQASVPSLDFGVDLLWRRAGSLILLPLEPCGWTDLGSPARLARWAQRRRADGYGPEPAVYVPETGDSFHAVGL